MTNAHEKLTVKTYSNGKSLLFKPNNKETRKSSVDSVLTLLLFTLDRFFPNRVYKGYKGVKAPPHPQSQQ